MPELKSTAVSDEASVVRFIHTADWQLGLKLRYLQPERAAQLRLIRFQTVRAIAALARQRQADFVLVAGDVLDDNGLGATICNKPRMRSAASETCRWACCPATTTLPVPIRLSCVSSCRLA